MNYRKIDSINEIEYFLDCFYSNNNVLGTNNIISFFVKLVS